VDVPVPANRERKGELRNPFKQRKAKAAASTATAPSSATAPTAQEDEGSTVMPPTDLGMPPVGITPPVTGDPLSPPETGASKPKTDPLDLYRISLRFGQAGKVRTRRDLARLTPLPNVDNPFFVFLGVLDAKGGKRAVFLVSTDVKATGDGICKPRPADCQTIEMRAGDTQFFDLERPTGPVQYQLDLLSIRQEGAGTASEAVAARDRASKAGGEVLRDADAGAVEGIDGYAFSRRTGLLQRTPVDDRIASGEDGTSEAPAAEAPPADPAAAAAAAAAAPVPAEASGPAEAVKEQGKRLRAAVRAVVRGVLGSLSSDR